MKGISGDLKGSPVKAVTSPRGILFETIWYSTFARFFGYDTGLPLGWQQSLGATSGPLVAHFPCFWSGHRFHEHRSLVGISSHTEVSYHLTDNIYASFIGVSHWTSFHSLCSLYWLHHPGISDVIFIFCYVEYENNMGNFMALLMR